MVELLDPNGQGLVETEHTFMGKPVFTSEDFCKTIPTRVYKRKNKRLKKKWMKRYGSKMIPRTDAEIWHHYVLCHPNTLWRFKNLAFIDPEEQK
jgi:hypothetical protein